MDNSLILSNTWILDKSTAKKQILELIEWWKNPLDMANWTFKITFRKDQWKASCYAEPEYRTAQLNFYLDQLIPQFKTNYELEEFVVHEMVHCLTWQLVDLTETLIKSSDDKTGVLWSEKEKKEENLVQKLSDGLVMVKYNLSSIPNSVTAHSIERPRATRKKKKK
jgi:hypothetical protein